MEQSEYKCVMLKTSDNVAVALTSIPQGATVQVSCQELVLTVQLIQSIEFGHKFAVKNICRGEDILKYGEVIGSATVDIVPGDHVHVHNLEGKRGRGDQHAASS